MSILLLPRRGPSAWIFSYPGSESEPGNNAGMGFTIPHPLILVSYCSYSRGRPNIHLTTSPMWHCWRHYRTRIRRYITSSNLLIVTTLLAKSFHHSTLSQPRLTRFPFSSLPSFFLSQRASPSLYPCTFYTTTIAYCRPVSFIFRNPRPFISTTGLVSPNHTHITIQYACLVSSRCRPCLAGSGSQ